MIYSPKAVTENIPVPPEPYETFDLSGEKLFNINTVVDSDHFHVEKV